MLVEDDNVCVWDALWNFKWLFGLKRVFRPPHEMFLTGERKSIFMLVTKKWELFFCMPSCLTMFHMKSGVASCNFFYIVKNYLQCSVLRHMTHEWVHLHSMRYWSVVIYLYSFLAEYLILCVSILVYRLQARSAEHMWRAVHNVILTPCFSVNANFIPS